MGNLYKLDARSMPRQSMVAATSTSTTVNLWLQSFGHLNLQDLILLKKKGMVNGLPALHNIKLECDGCALGKMHRDEFPLHVNRKERDILELVHTVICGPMQTRSLGGAYYFLLFTNDCTRFSWVYFLSNKSQAFRYFKEFKVMIENQTTKKIKILRSDQGGECRLNEFMNFCK